MQISKTQLLLIVASATLVGSVVSVAAQEGPAPIPEPPAAQVQQPEPPDEGKPDRPRGDKPDRPTHRRHPGPDGALGRAMRGEFVLPGRDGGPVTTVRIDRGVLESRDGNVLVVREEDGTVVRIPVTDETRIGRDGERATIEDLREGDRVATRRVKEGDGDFVTRHVRAISAERQAQIDQRKEECRANPEQCRAERRAQRLERKGREGLREPGPR